MTGLPSSPEHLDPLVSVIVPVFNGARFLRESLDSILQQTYSRVEVTVMDDASVDETPAILASYGDRIRAFRQPVNVGQFDNVNAGIEAARGEFIGVYHADDVYQPDIVEREVGFLRAHPEVGAVFCLDILVDQQNREYGRLRIPRELQGHRVLTYAQVMDGLLRYKNRFLVGPSAMVRAQVYREVGGYRANPFGIAGDLEMWLRIARAYPIGLLEAYLMRYRHFHGNLSQHYFHLRTEPEKFFTVMDHHLATGGRAVAKPDAIEAYEGHRAEDRLRIAVTHYIRGELVAARAMLRTVATSRVLKGRTLQRSRLLLLLLAFRVLTRLPRMEGVAKLFQRRWFLRLPPRPVA
jgi:GT2 family glycosyltransferase